MKLKLILFILFAFSCSIEEKKVARGKKTEVKIDQADSKIKKEYNPKSVCDCAEDGLSTLHKMLDVRQKFSDFDSYNNDYLAIEKVAFLLESWNEIREICMKKFATKLITPSGCNNPHEIRHFRNKLDKLGIST